MHYIQLVPRGELYKAILDHEFTGILYSRDRKKFDLPMEGFIQDEKAEAVQHLIFHRAMNKATSLLAATELCASDIRVKLKLRDYPETVIEAVIEALYDYGYLNDTRYAESYVRTYGTQKSRSRMEQELTRKGISAECYRTALDDYYQDLELDEDQVICNILEKQFASCDTGDERVKKRILSYMARRGFSPNKVNNYLT
jgi:regulatory protein